MSNCPICGRSTEHELPDSTFPDLCKKCAENEKTFRAKRKDGRVITIDQKSLF